MKVIEVIVSPNGETKIQTKGFAGRTCRAASEFLKKALGLVTEDRDTTPAEEQQCQQHYRS